MKRFVLIAFAAAALAADKKPVPPVEVSNENIALLATVVLSPDEIRQALGADLGPAYALVRIKVTPNKAGDPIRVSPDDFTLISRKDGDRSPALSPSQIAGRGAMVVKAAQQTSAVGTDRVGPVWGGIGGGLPQRLPGNGGTGGNTASGEAGTVDAKIDSGKGVPENPLLPILKAKVLPDKESRDPLEGLLYFSIEGKLKPKDLSLLYKGPAGRLVLDFKQ